MTIDVEHYRELCSLPGKFEAEGPETPYFYEQIEQSEELLSNDPEDSRVGDLFQVDVEESKAFDIGPWLLLWEDTQGFVYSRDFDNREEAEAFWEELTS